jgi:ParB family transcriptional regulator, chromosome partitioning protein
MRLEFHQLDRRWEHLRVRHPARQRQLLASLAEVGQQTPIVVVALEGQPDRYLVIDGYKRLAALQQLGRDTVEAVVWPLREAEALMLDRSLRFSAHETALEEGWLLAELEQRYGYGQEELARRFDRSLSWVSRRLALVDLLPEALQQQVREGQLSAHMAMKFLVPVARVSLDDCERMAAAFVQHHCNTRQAGQLYAAWRDGSPMVRQRLLDQPELFFKTQPPAELNASPAGAAALVRDLEMAAALLSRARRRLAGGGAAEMDHPQRQAVRRQIEHLRQQLNRLAERIPEEEEPDVEPIPTDHDSGTEPTRSEQTRDRAGAGHLPSVGPQSSAFQFPPGAGTPPSRESRTLPATDPGAVRHLQGESGASP